MDTGSECMWLMMMMATEATRTVTGSLRIEVGKQAEVIVASAGLLQDLNAFQDPVFVIKGDEVIDRP